MIKLKISFRLIVTIVSIIVAILLGLTRISDPEFVQVLRLKYFDQLQIKYPRVTEGQTYSVIVDIDEKSLREIGQWPGQELFLQIFLINLEVQACWFRD